MSVESERAKARLKSEIEALDVQRRGLETELESVEKESEVPVYNRATLDKLLPAAASALMADVRAGKAQLVD